MKQDKELIEVKEALDKEQHKGIILMINALEENMNLKIDTNHTETKLILNQILEQTKRTNGRVSKIEDTTIPCLKIEMDEGGKKLNNKINKLKLFNLMAEHPKIAVTIAAILILIIKFIPSEAILNYLSKIL
jgi:hypothetical protein